MSSRTMLETLACVATIAILTVGCATTTRDAARNQSTTATQSSPVALAAESPLAPLPRRTSDVLTAAEVAQFPALATAYDAVERLRPWFLHSRSTRTWAPTQGIRPAVFVNGVFQGEIDVLRSIPMSTVLEVQYVRPLDAVHRYGPEYQAGIVFVRSKG